MGHAAYMRGSQVISRQIAAELEAKRLVPVDRQYLGTIEARLAEANEELARLRERLAKVELQLAERRATVTAERHEHVAQTERLTKRARSAERAMLAYRRRWEWVSRLLRRSASPAAVAEARESLRDEGSD